MNPAVSALVDQALAEFSGELDRLVEVQRKLTPRRGREQASADICALLNTFSTTHLAATLAVAVLRLSEQNAPEDDPCPYTHAHTRHWCGRPTCRES